MTITFNVTDDVEQAIERKARRLGITASEYVRRITEKAAKPSRKATKPKETWLKTGADLAAAIDALNLSGSYGDPAIDSPELARQLRKQSETRIA